MNSPTKSSIEYAATLKMIELASEVSVIRNWEKPAVKAKIAQGIKIHSRLKALSYQDVPDQEVDYKLLTCLQQVAGIYEYPIAPILPNIDPPVINTGGGNVINNYITNNFGTPFQQNNISGVSEIVDSFAAALAKGAE